MKGLPQLRNRSRRIGAACAVIGAVLTATALPTIAAAAATGPYPGSLPDTASAKTVNGRGEFKNLKIDINQTAELTNQAISLTWSGMPSTQFAPVEAPGQTKDTYRANYLQIMQCWGPAAPTTDAINYVVANPGPAREQCEFGGGDVVNGVNLSKSPLASVGSGASFSRTVNYTADPAHLGDDSQYKPYVDFNGSTQSAEVPFRAVDGTVIAHHAAAVGPKASNGYQPPGWANPYYDVTTTNELDFNPSNAANGGGANFQALTAFEAPGLGCGAVPTGASAQTQCWLVIVPRGDQDADGTVFPAGDTTEPTLVPYASPLSEDVWKNRIAVPLSFLPVKTPCNLGADERETSGSELVTAAMLSWQAKLCGSAGKTFGYSTLDDDRARGKLASGASDLSFVSDPVPPTEVSTAVTYAPVSLSGVALGFVWDAATDDPVPAGQSKQVPPPIPTINLNPRLVAKLLTYSYQQAIKYRLSASTTRPSPAPSAYTWLQKNPLCLAADPEFVQLNPNYPNLSRFGDPLSSLQVELNGSDAAERVWSWIAADPKATAWLAGKPDEWGMQVSPYYTTDAAKNPGGALKLPIRNFPSSDPWCGIPSPTPAPGQTPICGIDVRGYNSGLTAGARNVLIDRALTTTAIWNTQKQPPGYDSVPVTPVVPGQRSLMTVTDTASSSRYGLANVNLQNAAGKFVAPTTASITAAAAKLADTGVKGVGQPDIENTDPAAYPLAMLTYAAVTTNGLDAVACADYAALITYADGDGQSAGTAFGQLPPGYVPLPATLRAQGTAAARTIAACRHDAAPAAAVADQSVTTSNDSGGGGTSVAIQPKPASVVPPAAAAQPAAVVAPVAGAQPSTANVAARGITGADPRIFAYAIPIAFLIGVAGVMVAPLLRQRRLPRRPGG